MSIVILNWRGGENDPFTYFSACMKQAFERMGRPTHVVDLDNSTVRELNKLDDKGIDFVILWQGLGLQLGATDTNPATIWDHLQVPVLCYHGDHPCLMPVHHKAVSPWVQHIYGTGAFAMFANKYIPRESSATFFPTPVWFTDGVKGRFEGDFFVFPKNLDDLDATLETWRRAPECCIAAFLLSAEDAIIGELRNGNRTSHHDIIDGLLNAEAMAMLRKELDSPEFAVRMHIHMLAIKSIATRLPSMCSMNSRKFRLKSTGGAGSVSGLGKTATTNFFRSTPCRTMRSSSRPAMASSMRRPSTMACMTGRCAR